MTDGTTTQKVTAIVSFASGWCLTANQHEALRMHFSGLTTQRITKTGKNPTGDTQYHLLPVEEPLNSHQARIVLLLVWDQCGLVGRWQDSRSLLNQQQSVSQN